jgi:exosortase E/protease (VPEID-CTERM system)
MSSERPTPPRQPLWLSLWPLYLLVLEYLAISVSFDALPLLEAAGGARYLGHLGIAVPGLFLIGTVSYVLSGRALRDELSALLRAAPLFGPSRLAAVLLNLVCFAGMWITLSTLLRLSARGAPPGAHGTLAFPLFALGSGVCLLFALLPPASMLRLAGRASRVLGLGVLLGTLAWGAGLASGLLWSSLQAATLYAVFTLMLPFSDRIALSAKDALIGTEDFVVNVAPECSGIEGLGLICVVMGVYLWSARARLRFPRALWLLPVALLAVFAGNVLRIALLIAVGVNISPEIALSGFHSKAGWLFFCGIALALIAVVQHTRWLARGLPNAAVSSEGTWSPARTYLLPLLTLIATSLVTALFSTGFDKLYGLRIVAVALALYSQRAHLPRPSWPVSWHAPAIGCGVFALWLWLVPLPPAAQVSALQQELAALGSPWSQLWLALKVLGSVLAVPIAEELAFRGFLLRRLIAADFTEVDKTRMTPLALAVSSLAFGALHPGAVAAGCLAGVAYALAQQLRGRTADAIVAHAVTNALIALDVLLGGAYWLWA